MTSDALVAERARFWTSAMRYYKCMRMIHIHPASEMAYERAQEDLLRVAERERGKGCGLPPLPETFIHHCPACGELQEGREVCGGRGWGGAAEAGSGLGAGADVEGGAMMVVVWVGNVYWGAYWDTSGRKRGGCLVGSGFCGEPDVPEEYFQDVNALIRRMTEIAPQWHGNSDVALFSNGEVAFYHAVLPLLAHEPVYVVDYRSGDGKVLVDRREQQASLFDEGEG